MIQEKEIPTNWKLLKVKEIGRVETGTTPSKKNKEYYGKVYPFYKPSDLEAGKNVRFSIDGLSELGLREARYAPENSTLITCIGATIGKTGLIKVGGAFNQQINAIIPIEEIHPLFIYYQTISQHFQRQIKDNASATTLPIINKGKFEILKMFIPGFEDQQQIVSKIEELFSELDKGIEQLKTVQQQLKVYRQSVLKWAFEGRLTNENVQDGKLTEGWIFKTLESLGDKRYPFSYGVLKPGEDVKDGTPIIKSQHIRHLYVSDNIESKISEKLDKEFKRTKIKGGEILLNLVGASIGRCAIAPQRLKGANVSRAVGIDY